MADLGLAEYEALRATIRERGTLRMWAILGGLGAWAFAVVGLLVTGVQGAIVLVPIVVLAGTFEVSFFIHTGVERIGRYIQVFFEEASGSTGWETTAMNYARAFATPTATPAWMPRWGPRFPHGLDPLFLVIFSIAGVINFFSALPVATRSPAWLLVSFVAHVIFGWRLVTAQKMAATQRATDLDRFRKLKNDARPT